MQVRTASGVVKIKVWFGAASGDEPALKDRLAFTVTTTLSYEIAAAVARKYNSEADDSTLHALTHWSASGATN